MQSNYDADDDGASSLPGGAPKGERQPRYGLLWSRTFQAKVRALDARSKAELDGLLQQLERWPHLQPQVAAQVMPYQSASTYQRLYTVPLGAGYMVFTVLVAPAPVVILRDVTTGEETRGRLAS